MAESVDASVSNTDGAIRPGSIPGSGTEGEPQALLFIFCRMMKVLNRKRLTGED